MGDKTKKVLKAISTLIIAIFVFLAIAMVGVRIFGLQIYSVLSPSMLPYYPPGSLVYVVETDLDELKPDDVITFKISGGTATHRIYELVTDEESGETLYRTKGDHNPDPDGGLVRGENVIGKVVFCLPLLGYLAVFIQQPPGTYVAICFAVALIIGVIIIDMLTGEKDKKENKEDEKV